MYQLAVRYKLCQMATCARCQSQPRASTSSFLTTVIRQHSFACHTWNVVRYTDLQIRSINEGGFHDDVRPRVLLVRCVALHVELQELLARSRGLPDQACEVSQTPHLLPVELLENAH